jgi:hypothetical protein
MKPKISPIFLDMDEIIEVGNVRKLNWPSKMESKQG